MDIPSTAIHLLHIVVDLGVCILLHITMLYTQAFLDRYREEHEALPSRIAAWIGESPP